MVNTNFQKVPFTVLQLMAVAQLTHLAPVIAIFVWVDSSFSIALATYLVIMRPNLSFLTYHPYGTQTRQSKQSNATNI